MSWKPSADDWLKALAITIFLWFYDSAFPDNVHPNGWRWVTGGLGRWFFAGLLLAVAASRTEPKR